MARFGNSSVSGLINAANAAASSAQTYNDAIAGQTYANSAKTDGDFATYQAYLQSQAAKTPANTMKGVSYTNALTSAHKSYTSAIIQRTSTAVNYGDVTPRDKYATLSALRDAAVQNGDTGQAQGLESQMASLSMSIQNADQAAAAKAQSSSDRADRLATSSQDKSFMQAVSGKKDLIQQLNISKAAGKLTPAQYDDRMTQAYLGNDKGPGLLAVAQQARDTTGDPSGKYQNYLDAAGADKQVQGYINGNQQAQGSVGDNFAQTLVKDAKGVYSFHDRPSSEVTGNLLATEDGKPNGKPILDANGHSITLPQYAAPQAFTDKKGGVNGFQYMSNIDANGNIAPGTGAGVMAQVNGRDINTNDPTGVPYFYAPDGTKKFISIDPVNGRPIMGNDPSVVTGDNSKIFTGSDSTNAYGQTYGPAIERATKAVQDFNPIKGAHEFADSTMSKLSNVWKPSLANTGNPVGAIMRGVPGGGTIANWLDMNNHTQDLAKAQAALQSVQTAKAAFAAASQAHAQSQAALAAQPVPTRSPRATGYNPVTNTLTGVAGPVRPTPAVVQAQAKAANTVGTPEFNAGIGGFGAIKF